MLDSKLCKKVRSFGTLEAAWKHVRNNAQKSHSKKTRAEIEQFGEDIHTELRRIVGRLSHPNFKFDKARGWAAPPKSEGKGHRPIVISSIPTRIISRAILDILMEQAEILRYVDHPYSFGGIKKVDPDALAAVPGAVQASVYAINSGNPYFIRSDISGFFTKIPKKPVLQIIKECTNDENFCELIEGAMTVELDNLAELREHQSLFPLEDIGVAQGCALSPLMGNILLKDFDAELNSGECTCIRYIDDFLILGPSEDSVRQSFERACEILLSFDMQAYDPIQSSEKAEQGNVIDECLTFLGVEVLNGSIRPSKKNRGKLVSSVNEIVNEYADANPNDDSSSAWPYEKTYLKMLGTLNAVISGWGNQYYFCNDRQIMDHLDKKISKLIDTSDQRMRRRLQVAGSIERRRLLGVKSLHDCRVDPIQWKLKVAKPPTGQSRRT